MIRSHGYVAQRAARQKRVEQETETRNRECRARSEGRISGRADERRRHELAMEAGSESVRLAQKPPQEFVRVALRPRIASAADFRRLDYRHAVEMVMFRAVKKAWQSPEGHTVVWWDWEFVG